jgi:hypothetical protein
VLGSVGVLPFIDRGVLAHESDMDAYAATRVADSIRRELVKRRESFVFETAVGDVSAEYGELAVQAVGGSEGFEVVRAEGRRFC